MTERERESRNERESGKIHPRAGKTVVTKLRLRDEFKCRSATNIENDRFYGSTVPYAEAITLAMVTIAIATAAGSTNAFCRRSIVVGRIL